MVDFRYGLAFTVCVSRTGGLTAAAKLNVIRQKQKEGEYSKMKNYVVLAASLFLAACFANPTYIRPPKHSEVVQNELVIQKGFDDVWTALIEYSSKSFFAIKNFEKASGLLTLSFGAGDPMKFVDCGELNSPSMNYSGSLINAVKRTGYAELDGVMNIFVKPLDSKRTLVSVNARYILNVKDGTLPKETWSFDTGSEQTRTIGILLVTCKPTLEAEKDILNGIKNIAAYEK